MHKKSWAIVRYEDEKINTNDDIRVGELSLSFVLSFEDDRERQFNLRRPVQETAADVADRIGANVSKVLNKRKKKKGKMEANDHVDDVVVKASFESSSKELITDQVLLSVLQRGDEVYLSVANSRFEVRFNPPSVISIKMSSYTAPMSHHLYYAQSIKCHHVHTISYEWYYSRESATQWTWIENSDHGILRVPEHLVGAKLKLVCLPLDKEGREGDIFEQIVDKSVIEGPKDCYYKNRTMRSLCSDQVSDENASTLRVISYNVLADLYADREYARSELFAHCDPQYLKIDYRVRLVLDELLGYKGDVICLQEIDNKVFNRDLSVVLSTLDDFEGLFCGKGDECSEGEALFYRRSKFELLQHERIVFKDHLLDHKLDSNIIEVLKREENDRAMKTLSERPTVLQLAVLKLKDRSDDKVKGLVVANTHFYFRPDADHIRLLHAALALRYIERVLESLEGDFGVIFAGDFNSTPPFGVYQLMTLNNISIDHSDWKSCSEEPITGLQVSHNLDLKSACGTPSFTNYCLLFNGCLDYIFVDNSKFDVVNFHDFPSEEEIKAFQALPNECFPSDHVACVTTLRWKDK